MEDRSMTLLTYTSKKAETKIEIMVRAKSISTTSLLKQRFHRQILSFSFCTLRCKFQIEIIINAANVYSSRGRLQSSLKK